MDHSIKIIGHGLAGSILSLMLRERNVKFQIFHDASQPSSSRAAAGLYNPITGKVMKLTWNAPKLFPFLEEFYGSWQNKLDATFLHPKPIVRPFTDSTEANNWTVKAGDAFIAPFIRKIHPGNHFSDIQNPYGSLELNFSGYLDTNAFLNAVLELNKKDGSLVEQAYREPYTTDPSDIIIHCEGVHNRTNPHFSWLPYRPVKGETLVVKGSLSGDRIFNRGVFVIPMEGKLKMGATYSWKPLNWEPSEEGKNQLMEKYQKLTGSGEFKEIMEHSAGLRPATKDRRPIIGAHPKQQNRYVFGGWGSKGVSMIPFYANQFLLHLLDGQNLDNEVSISRFYSLYSTN